MIVRIVQLTFDPLKTGDFLNVFNGVCEESRVFPGCRNLELWHSTNPDNIDLTDSLWDSQKSLDQYRFSELFKSTWAQKKVLFSAPPVALSMEKTWPASS